MRTLAARVAAGIRRVGGGVFVDASLLAIARVADQALGGIAAVGCTRLP